MVPHLITYNQKDLPKRSVLQVAPQSPDHRGLCLLKLRPEDHIAKPVPHEAQTRKASSEACAATQQLVVASEAPEPCLTCRVLSVLWC